MERLESRLDQEKKAWQEREKHYTELFKADVLETREFLKEKLKHYDKIRATIIANPINEDKIAIKGFLIERRQLAAQVYPNPFIRFIEKLVSIFRVKKNVVKVQQSTVNNSADVRNAMVRAGLGEYFGQVQQQMKQGNREFSLPVSLHVKESEKMELQLNFKKDDNGNYHFNNYRATLHSELDKSKPRQYTFEMREGEVYNILTAYNLLTGRAVQTSEGGSWKQLDINDKDGAGNLRMKHFLATYGFELEKSVFALPLKDIDRNVLMQQLRNGDKVTVNLDVNKKESIFQVEANPLKKEIAIYDSANQKVSLNELNGKQGQQQERSNVRRLMPKQTNKQQQSKGRTVKI